MDPATLEKRLARERKARQAAERLLEEKAAELFEANQKLAAHAANLTEEIETTRDVAATWKGQADRVQSDLEQAERRLWAALEAMNDGFALFDAENRLVAANSAYRSVFKAGAAGLRQGAGYAAILGILTAEGLVDLQGATAADWEADMLARFGDPAAGPKVIRFANGQYVQLFDRRTPDGDVVSLGVNITEMMRMQAAVDALQDGFVLFDRDDRFITANARYREIYAANAEFRQAGSRFEDILRKAAEAGRIPAAEGRVGDWVSERMAVHREGGSVIQQISDGRWLKIVEQPTPDGGRVGLHIDITEIKAREAELEDARAEAEAASRAKSAFLANMSHEIRTPMNGVVGMAELLAETRLDAEQKLFADTIRASGEALLTIINDVLDFSKIEAGKLELYPEPFDVERAIHDVMMLLKPKAVEKQIDLVIDYDMFLPVGLVGDTGRIRQVLMNLVGNAIKFTASGHVMVRATGVGNGDRQELHVTVEDTGIGIPAEKLDHVFGEFNQVEEASNRKFEGTGLGLAISRRLIGIMGGEVWVESTLGEGSCFGFRIELPIAQGSSQRDPHAARQSGSVLVVDDLQINRTILERHLRAMGLNVVTAQDAAAALRAVQRRGTGFDAILTDLVMPGIDGMALAARLRDGGYNGPIFLLSSDSFAAKRPGDDALVSAVIQKPILRSDLQRLFIAGANTPIDAPPMGPGTHSSQAQGPSVTNDIVLDVLLAEDNRTNQLVFRKMVEDLPLSLRIAVNGAEAVAQFEAQRPDLVFMDVSMPEMDGIEATARIRALEAERGLRPTPIIALTAHAMTGDAERFLAAGMSRFMTKPVRKALLAEAIADRQMELAATPAVLPALSTGAGPQAPVPQAEKSSVSRLAPPIRR